MEKYMNKKEKTRLDKLWSHYVRQRTTDTCERCGKPGNNPHHIIGRRNLSVRWDVENGINLCSGCHTLRTDSAHQSPGFFHEWIIAKRGQQWWEDLKTRSIIVSRQVQETNKMLLEAWNDKSR